MALERPPRDLRPCPRDGTSRDDTIVALRSAGFQEPETAEREWGTLLELAGRDERFARHLERTWEVLSRSADPDLSLLQLSRQLGSLRGDDGDAGLDAFLARWDTSPIFRDALLLVLGVSPAVGEDLLRDWSRFDPENWRAGWETRDSMARRVERFVEAQGADPGEDEFLATLKRFWRAEEVRIIFLDEYLRVPAEQVTRQISWLADVIVQGCLDRALAEVARQFRVEPSAGGLVILALGKLGGLELNYSSDIDLTFVMDDAPPPGDSPPAVNALHDRALFFTRVAEQTIHLLSKYAGGPPLFRVDTRLRPEGSRGHLVWTVSTSLNYYESVGRTWERQALIRLRPIAGDLELGRRYRDRLDPFIFRKLLTEDALNDLKNLKAQIESLASSRGHSSRHVKIGRGGIRDVEFIVQYLQLLYGASYPEVKHANVFEVLESLARRGVLNAEEADSLGIGYRLLRQVENRIQIKHRLQEHVLPESHSDLRRIARGLGYETVERFRAALAEAQSEIRTVFRRLFEGAETDESRETTLAAILELPHDAVRERGQEFLEQYGFEDPAAAFDLLRRASGERTALLDQAHAVKMFRRIALPLLREVSQFPDPDRTLANFCDAVGTLGARSIFFELLHESREALRKMVEICGHSRYLVDVLRGYPGLFDEVIDCLRIGYSLERDALLEPLARTIEECRRLDSLTPLFEFKYLHVLVAAFRDLERHDNLTTTMLNISRVAEVVLEGALRLAEPAVQARFGDPSSLEGDPGYVVLALGKLGGEEMNYRSDLDLVFLYRGNGKTSGGYSAPEYFTELAQELFGTLGKRGPLGVLWDADARLRPMGSKNVLAVSFDTWRGYFEKGTARTWERQAFLRVRRVAGDARLGDDVLQFVMENGPLRPDEDADAVFAEIVDMRRRLEESVPAGDIKRGHGGIVDVEFIVQALQLRHGREHADVIAPNTVTGIRRLTGRGLLDSQVAGELLSAYQFLRWLETRFSLLLTPEESISGLDQERLRSLIQRIGYRSSGAEAPEEIFLEELAYHLERNRANFERVVGGLTR